VTLGARLAVVAKPAVLRLMTAGLISGIGDWLLTIALPIYVYTLTRSTLSSATAMVLELVAALVCGQFAGLVVDRFERRRLLVLTNLAQAALLLPLLAVHGTSELWIVYLVSAVQSAVGTVSGPAENALIPSLVEADELVRANTIISTGGDLAKLIGAAGAGVVLAVVGLGGVVAVDALSFVAAALLLALRFPASSVYVPRPPDGKTRFQRWREGLALVRRTPPLRNAFVILVINQLAQGIALALIVAFFVEDLHRGSAAVGVFRSFQVVGTIPAGIIVAVYASERRPEALLKASLLAGAVIEFFIWNGPSITHWFGYYLILEVLLGLPGVTAFIAFSTILQTATPREFLGRVFSLLGALSGSALLLSVLAGGWLGEFLTPRTLLNGTVALEALTGVAAVMLFRKPAER
jgi:MFS family permease